MQPAIERRPPVIMPSCGDTTPFAVPVIDHPVLDGRSFTPEVRGAVLKQLAEVEQARWAGGPDDIDYREFQKALHSLETTAFIARTRDGQ